MAQKLIITVCRGNIGRSPFAEAIIRRELAKRHLSEDIYVISRGVQGTAVDPKPVSFPNITYYPELYADTKPILDKFGVAMSGHTSTPISPVDAEKASILLAVDGKTRDALRSLFPGQAYKIYLVSELVGGQHDITDPEGVSGQEKQKQIFTELHEMLTVGFPVLIDLLKMAEQKTP